jgi:hypothetical protein
MIPKIVVVHNGICVFFLPVFAKFWQFMCHIRTGGTTQRNEAEKCPSPNVVFFPVCKIRAA